MYEEICNKTKISKLLNKAFHERYLELKSIRNMPTSLALTIIDNPLPYEADLRHINGPINKRMDKNKVKRKLFYKEFWSEKKKYFSVIKERIP